MELALERGQSLVSSGNKMPNSTPRVSLPTYVLPLLVTLLLAFVANLGYSVYWAGQMSSNQQNMSEAIRELKGEVRELREQNQRLRETQLSQPNGNGRRN
jgi:uncharacterized protein HemX